MSMYMLPDKITSHHYSIYRTTVARYQYVMCVKLNIKSCQLMIVENLTIEVRPQPIMLKILPIMLLSSAQKSYPLIMLNIMPMLL